MSPAEDWEVPLRDIASDVALVRNDLKNYIDNERRAKKEAKPAEDRAKQIDAIMKVALSGLILLEGLARAPAIEVGTRTPSNGMVIVYSFLTGVLS